MFRHPRRFLMADPPLAEGHNVPESVREAMPATLLPMTIASMNDTLQTWLEQRLTRGVALVPGGWDAWAQVDLLAWLHASFGATAERRWDAQRNVRVYADPDLRADLVFNTVTHDLVRPMLVIEIVAESSLEERTDFLNRMHREAEQLRLHHLTPRYAMARRMVLALTIDLATATALQRHQFGVVATTKGGCAALWRDIEG